MLFGIRTNTSNSSSLLGLLGAKYVDLLSILAVCIQTDGSLVERGNNHRICFASSDSILASFAESLFSKLSKFKPNVYTGAKGITEVKLTDRSLTKKLFELSPEFKTFSENSAIQPTINFLYKKNLATRIWAIRFAFSTDGCISLSKRNKPELNLACCTKSLVDEWKLFLEKFGIKANISNRNRYKQGVAGLRIYNFQSIYNFYCLGGFVEGVKISKKSKRYVGLRKNELLQKVVKRIMETGGIEPPISRFPMEIISRVP
tara:strand:- start:6631 stop:7410 length:780 start_codon:yes stop_codon:yes gene_type:complete